jgi:hypothetical protein
LLPKFVLIFCGNCLEVTPRSILFIGCFIGSSNDPFDRELLGSFIGRFEGLYWLSSLELWIESWDW